MDFVEIKSGPAEVISFGTIIAFQKNPIEITYGRPDEELRIIFVFQDEEGKDKQEVKIEVPDPNTLKLININFKNPLGTGPTNPLKIGNLRGRILYLHYRVYDIGGDSDKTVHYTIYIGEEVSKND